MGEARSELPFKEFQKRIESLDLQYKKYDRIGLIDLAYGFNQIVYKTYSVKKNLEKALRGIIVFAFEKIIQEYVYTSPEGICFFDTRLFGGSDLFYGFKDLLKISPTNPLHDFDRYILLFRSYEHLILNPNDLEDLVKGLTYTQACLLADMEAVLKTIFLRKKNSDEIVHLAKAEIPINEVLKEKLTNTIKRYRSLAVQGRKNDIDFMDFINKTGDAYASLYDLDPYILRKELYFFIMADMECETHILSYGKLYGWCQEDTNKHSSREFSERHCNHLCKYLEKFTQIKSNNVFHDDVLISVEKNLPAIRKRLEPFLSQTEQKTQASVPARLAKYTTQSLFSFAANRIVKNHTVSDLGQKVVVTVATTVGLTIAGPGGGVIGACVGTIIAPEITSLVCNKLMEPIGNLAGNVVLTFTDNSIKMIFGSGKNEIVKEISKEFFEVLLKSPISVVNDKLKLALLKIYRFNQSEISEFIHLPEQLFSLDCKKELCQIYAIDMTIYPALTQQRVSMKQS